MSKALQTDALNVPVQEVDVARYVIAAADATVASTTGIMAARAATGPCTATLVASTAPTDTLTIAFVATQAATPVGKITFVLDAAADDNLAVSAVDATGVITILLANSTAAKNTATLIQAAIRAVTPTGEGGVQGVVNGISVAAVVCTAGGNWNTAAVAEGAGMTSVACVGGGGETITPNVTALVTQPSTPRNITATAGGTGADIGAVSVIIYGTNINDQAISETLTAFTVNSAATKAGTKAFKTITSIFLPSHDGTAATVSIGYGEILGLPHMFSVAPYLRARIGGTLESTAPTIAVDADEIEKNTIDLYSALSSAEVELLYFLT